MRAAPERALRHAIARPATRSRAGPRARHERSGARHRDTHADTVPRAPRRPSACVRAGAARPRRASSRAAPERARRHALAQVALRSRGRPRVRRNADPWPNESPRGALMPRRPRCQTDRGLHHVTTRGNNRQAMFDDTEDRERFYDLLGYRHRGVSRASATRTSRWGITFTSFSKATDDRVSTLLWFVSHRYALAYNRRHGRLNHLLGRRFHASAVPDRACRTRCLRLHRDESGARRPLPASAGLGVRLLPGTRARRTATAAPGHRPHDAPLRRPRDDVRGRSRGCRRAGARRQADARGDPPPPRTAHAETTSGTPASSTATPCPRSRAHYGRSASTLAAMAR